MLRKKLGKDTSRNNLEKLIELYNQYRQMQYDIFKQYNLCLEDPKFDALYLDITCLEHFRGYIKNDLNGTDNYSSTTEIIKDFRKLLDQYDIANGKIEVPTVMDPRDTLLNER